MNTNCFGFIDKRTCFALDKLYCKNKHCNFYKDKSLAKKNHLKYKPNVLIQKDIDNYFKSL